MCAGSPSKSKSGETDLSLNPQRRLSTKKEKKLREEKACVLVFRREKKGKWILFSNKEEKGRNSGYRSSSSDRRSQLTERDSGAFQPRCLTEKKEAQHREEKKSLPQKSYTPFSTLTLIVPSILRNFLRTSTTSQT